jgi:hypothetical protein
VRDERAELVVCGHCGSHLELGDVEHRVLRKRSDRRVDFLLDLGDPFRWNGVRYEVAARLAWIEDGSTEWMTREWLLFHPARGSLWLSEYRGSWELSHRTHVMPEGTPPSRGRCRTADGRTWSVDETGERELYCVDGGLPWLARLGDKVSFVEMSDAKGQTYEIETTRHEVEYVRGEWLSHAQVSAATGKAAAPPPEPRAFPWIAVSVVVAGLCVLANLILLVSAAASGTVVLAQALRADAVSGEILTEPFALTEGSFTRIEAEVPDLDNAWMAIDAALVRDEDTVVHAFDADVEYYHGREGGESWSEGDRDTSTLVAAPSGGAYRLLLHAVSGEGESSTATASTHDVRVRVIDDALDMKPGMMALFLCGGLLAGATLLVFKGLSGSGPVLHVFAVVILLSSTMTAWAATVGGWTVDDAEHPDGLSLREESARGGSFFAVYATRSHTGGGLSSGK